MKTIVALALLSLAGCATHGKFVSKMDRFVGQGESAVIGSYGAPAQSYTLTDGSRVISYTRGGTMVLPGITTYTPVTSNTSGNLVVNQGIRQSTGIYSSQTTTMLPQQAPAMNIQMSCTVHFTITSKGIVSAWRAEGSNCVSDG